MRARDCVLTRVGDEIADPRHPDWVSALDAAFAILVDSFRNEAGFRGLRVGDVIDLRPVPAERPFNAVISDRLLDGLIARFGFEDTPELRFAFETAIEVSDALAARAFARNPQGDEAFLDASRDVVYGILVDHLGAVAPSA